MSFIIEVENVKCSGCANTIQTKLLKVTGVNGVEIEISLGQVKIEAEHDLKPELKVLLESMGYPEVGSVEGLKAAKAKAKSFVSCAIGKMTEDKSSK